jgi:hypothetical protein
MFNKSLLWIKTNCLLVSIFVSVAVLIFAQSYFFGVYISPDSTNYLRAAQALRDDYGFRMNAAAGDIDSYFSIWPIGYPAMIALVSKIINTEIYLASKILSVVILAIIFIILHFRFKKHAWMYALIAVNLGFLQIFYYTWSEQPFILGLIWISFAAIDILESEQIRYSHYISICLASLFLFLSRYIGAFSIGVIGLLAIYFMITGFQKKSSKNIKKAGLLITIALIVIAIMAFYLYNNLKNSGFITGMERTPIKETPFLLFLLLCKAQVIEMQYVFSVFFVMSIGIACVIYALCAVTVCRFLYIKRGTFYKYIPIPAISFLSIGLLYWFSIVIMRFSSAFDGFSYRLLFPSSALFIIGIIVIIENHYPALIEKITLGLRRYILALVLVLSLFSDLAYPLYKAIFKAHRITGYQEIRSGIIKDLKDVPAHSLVIMEWGLKESYSNFIRTDLIIKAITWPQSPDEVFLSVEKSKEAYLYYDWQLISDDIKEELNSRFNGSLDIKRKLIRIR